MHLERHKIYSKMHKVTRITTRQRLIMNWRLLSWEIAESREKDDENILGIPYFLNKSMWHNKNGQRKERRLVLGKRWEKIGEMGVFPSVSRWFNNELVISSKEEAIRKKKGKEGLTVLQSELTDPQHSNSSTRKRDKLTADIANAW